MSEIILAQLGIALLTIATHIAIVLVERHLARRQVVQSVPEKVIKQAENRREVIAAEHAQVGTIEET